ncbi:hypothetical protein [Microlunatus parietis]|uniref:Uncharacterized protein n=1 Tax=Microlunatus parietis TaxID=682979 RepID=A0A7Y9IDA0_9ACTN|nr:hypothetical protein [Microlunatus parietis]NYE74816.1 hypothetical protein [Microlunatus parietis]
MVEPWSAERPRRYSATVRSTGVRGGGAMSWIVDRGPVLLGDHEAGLIGDAGAVVEPSSSRAREPRAQRSSARLTYSSVF